jgi:amino acid permease
MTTFDLSEAQHTNRLQMFSILNEIKDNRPTRTTGVVTGSIGTAASIYVLVAITGYLSFGDNVVGNIVSQYIPSVASTIGRAAIVILVMFSYPLQVHPCRASVDAVSKWRPTGRRNQELTPAGGSPSRSSLLPNKMPSRPKPEEMSDIRFAVITTGIVILSYITAMTVSSLDKVLAYVGSTGSTSISFILPGLFYYKISDPDSPHHQRLMKGNDDEEYESDSGDEGSSPTEANGSWRSAWGAKMKGRQWRRDMLRKASLALAVYGFLVMTVCLATNTYFNARE